MSDVRLGPFTVGIDHVSPEVSMPRGAFKDAVNMDIDREGNLNLRPGLTLLHASDAAGTIWTSLDGYSYVQDGAAIYRATFDGISTLTLGSAIATLDSADPVSFADLLDGVCFSSRTTIGTIKGTTSRRLGVEAPGGFAVTPLAYGGMFAGNYAAAITYLVGNEEGEASTLTFFSVADNGGVRIALPTPIESNVTAINVYVTQPSGEILYWRARVPIGMTSFTLGRTDPGKVCDTVYKTRMLPGPIVRYWNGRLLVARGNAIYFSEPLRYGLTDVREGFVQEARRITMMQPVQGGVFVGTPAGVVFYRGTSPKEWTRVVTDGKPPIAFTGASVPANELGGDVGGSGQYVAMWLSQNGFVIGTVDGALVQPQATRIRLNADSGALVVHHRKAVAVVS